MKHTTHDKDIMSAVLQRCKEKYPAGHKITDLEWNIAYDNILADCYLQTIDFKIRHGLATYA